MSRHFTCEYVKKFADRRGRLDAMGAAWSEEASWRYSLRAQLWLSLGTAVAGLLLSVALLPVAHFLSLIGLSAFGWCLAFTWDRLKGPLPQRAVIFHRDGTVSVPHGTPGDKKGGVLNVGIDEIANIQDGKNFSGVPNDWTRAVSIITHHGRTIPVSRFLHEHEALEVVTRLNLALATMREQVAAPVR